MDGNDTNTDGKTQEQLDAEARARQDVSQHPRMLAMQAIADKHEGSIEEQLLAEGLSSRGDIVDEPADVQRRREELERQQQETTTTATPPAGKKTSTVDQQLLAQFGDEPVPMEALDSLKVRVKIDGAERVVSVYDLRRTAQLDGAAQARLEQANAILKKAQETAAQTTTGERPPVGVEPKPGNGDSGATSQDVTAIAKDLVQSLFVGDEEAATATVVKLLQGRQNPQLDPAALAAQLAPAVKQQLSQEEAEAQFRSDFKDVVSDPILVSAADRFFAEAQAEDPQKSYAELLAEAGQRTREWVGRVTGKPATETRPRSTREEKLAAKQRIDNVRSLNTTQGTQEEPIQSPSQVIADMRKARGLA